MNLQNYLNFMKKQLESQCVQEKPIIGRELTANLTLLSSIYAQPIFLFEW